MKRLLFISALVLGLLPLNALAVTYQFSLKNTASVDIVRFSVKNGKVEGFTRIGRGKTITMTVTVPDKKCSIPIWVHYDNGLVMDSNFNFCKYGGLEMGITRE